MRSQLEINGKRYNAVTGALVSGQASGHSRRSAAKARNIDGVVHSSSPKAITAKPAQHKVSRPSAIKTRPVMDVQRSKNAAVPKSRSPKHSQTLMRHTLTKPVLGHKQAFKVQTHTDVLVAEPMVLPKLAVQVVDTKRWARAKRIAKSKLISRFGDINSPLRLAAPIAVRPAAAPALRPVAKAPAAPKTPLASARHKPSTDIFQEALSRAKSHEQPRLAKKHVAHKAKKSRPALRRATNLGASALAIILIVGFIAYQNAANFKLHLASSKAGFAASLPRQTPSGFSLGKFSYSPGLVAVNYHSNSDSRHFALEERASNWNSQTLLNEYVAVQSGQGYQTVETAGRTIYLYGDNNATWVDKGVWYKIQTGKSLSHSQLIDLASSL
ncbi:MAG TPA: hypothetical protein VLG37_01510 [Candidatus Saccharimonadales bacterium]|nr:hypothetical protein [Candidatus Saccharimonadales bacterium]